MNRKKTALQRLRSRLESISGTQEAAPLFGIETVLLIISILYGAVMAIRARGYRIGLLSSRSLPCRVVAIGNITAGGTGKTPMTIFTAQAIQRLGYRVVVISRGYKGRLERKGGVVSDGRSVFYGPDIAGDEPYLMASALTGIPVVVGSDRYQAGMLAMRRFAPQVIVLDDAFQHLRLRRDLDLVLLDWRSPLGNGYMIPRGRLREPVSALQRAHGLVVTRCEDASCTPAIPEGKGCRPVFHTRHLPVVELVNAAGDAHLDAPLGASILKGKNAVAFSGLADNDQFFRSLKEIGCRLLDQLSFADHHPYGIDDLNRILGRAAATDAELLVTSAKDWVKIKPLYHWPLAVAAIDVRIGLYNDETRFHDFLSAALSKAATGH